MQWALTVTMLMAVGCASVSAHAQGDTPAATAQLQEIEVLGVKPGPRLWRVSAPGHVLWLLGTLPNLPAHMTWRSDELRSVLAATHRVVLGGGVKLEVGPWAGLRLYLQWRGARELPRGQHLQDWLPAPLYERFESQRRRLAPSESGLESLRPLVATGRLYGAALHAAGLTRRDELESQLEHLARDRQIPVRDVRIRFDDPAAAVRQWTATSPGLEAACVNAMLQALESDLPAMQARARAWADGDVARLRELPHTDMRAECETEFASVPSVAQSLQMADERWYQAAASALHEVDVALSVRPVDDLLAPGGVLERFRRDGYEVSAP